MRTRLRRCLSALTLGLLALAPAALAQPVRLELRIVPQVGTPSISTSGVTDLPGTTHDPFISVGETRRFEVQYRIIDLLPADGIFPAGLTVAQMNITTTLSGVQGTLTRALLSRFESQQASSTPPVSPDQSGVPVAPFVNATGVHRPFRAGFAAPSPNNNHRANGQANIDLDPSSLFSLPGPGNLRLTEITPLALSQSDQNAPGGWYGLYSFTFTFEGVVGGFDPLIRFTAELVADPNTFNRFGYYSSGNPAPLTSPNATSATASVSILTGGFGACCGPTGGCGLSTGFNCSGPGMVYRGDGTGCGPGQCEPGVACCLAAGGCVVRTASLCAAQGHLAVTTAASCSPTPCGPPFACCLPGFTCLIAQSTSDCVTAGGQPLLRSTCPPATCCPAPVITSQPQSQVFSPPGPVVLNVGASFPGTVSHRWRKNGVDLFDGGRFSGTGTATLTINPSQPGDAGSYDVRVTGSCGVAVTSAAAVLTPCTQPLITTSPVDTTVAAGGTAVLTVAAGGSGTLVYQWRRNGLPLANSGRITGVTTPTLTITAVVPADDAFYDAVVATQCGTATSNYAALVVSCAPGALDCNANAICDALELGGLRDLTSPEPTTDDRFGWSASLDGNRVLVGARTASTPAGQSAGAAYIFANIANNWTLEATLNAPDGAASADFGNLVALQGQWAIVSSRMLTVNARVGAGAVYIFRNTGGTSWSFFQKITEPVPTGGSQFGHGLDLDADRVVIGALHGNGTMTDSGVAYVHRFNGINWARESTLLAPDGAAGDGFGISVAIDDPYLIVGAPYDTDTGVNSGSAYIYFRSFDGWALQSKVRARTPQADSTFGELVAISGDLAMANCPRESVGGLTFAGAVYAFRRTDTRWTQQRRLVAPRPAALELFGFYLALEGDLAAMGGFQRTVAGVEQAGAVDIFKRRGNFWTRADRIDSPRPDPFGFFGYSLSASGGRLAVGAMRGSARLVPAAGWVRVFDLAALDCDDNGVPDVCQIAGGTATDADGNGIPDGCQGMTCRADFNDFGGVTIQDLFDFLSDYFAANLTADFNDSGGVTVQDIFDYITAYFAGCP